MANSRLRFRPRQRLTHARQFEAVYEARMSRSSGPLVVHAAPNGLEFARLGLSVGKRAGGAVERNAFKRRIREAFRLVQNEMPVGVGLDIVVNVRAHGPRKAEEYQKVLLDLVGKLAGDLQKKVANGK